MSTAIRRPVGPRRLRDVHACRVDIPARVHAIEATVNPHGRGGRVVFEIHFTSPMTDADFDLLGRQLGMTTHSEHKLLVDPNSPAVARLDDRSGLFLERGDREGRWLLQARTWGAPSAQTIHVWRVRAALVVHQLDPAPVLPAPIRSAQPDLHQLPVGRAARGKLASIRRRLVGLA